MEALIEHLEASIKTWSAEETRIETRLTNTTNQTDRNTLNETRMYWAGFVAAQKDTLNKFNQLIKQL